MLPKVYKVSTKIITSNDNVVCAARVFKYGFTDIPIIQKLCSVSSNQVPMCRGEEYMADIQRCLCAVCGGNVMPAHTVHK